MLAVHVFRWSLGDCSNHGISEKADQIMLINAGKEPLEPGKKYAYPLAKLVPGVRDGTIKVVPVDANGQELDGWSMFGGNFAYSSDSRFHEAVERITGHRSYGPVPIHDRFE